MTDPTSRTPAMLFMGDLVIVARQLRLITEARRRGLAPLLVITPDTDPERFAACRADDSHPLSQLEDVVLVDDAKVDLVFPAVQGWLREYDVQGVLCIGDFFVEPVGLMGDCLGVPGAGAAASRICRNKLFQRTALPALSPPWRVVGAAERAGAVPDDLNFPIVVKPAGRFSSLGVRQVKRPEELPEVLLGYPQDETLLIEERVVGPEVSVEALVQNGEVFWAGVTQKATNEHSGIYFTEMGHTSPAPLPAADERALLEANARALRRVGFRDGITHTEFRLSEGGPILMEMAARLPGDGITFLWELATGRPLEPVMIDLALGNPVPSFPVARRRACQVYLEHPEGRLRDVQSTGPPVSWVDLDSRWPALEPAGADEPARSRAVVVTRMPGDRLGPQTDSTQRSASVLFDAPLDAPVEELARKFADEVSITVG